ncbi:ribonuclease P protein component [Cyanobacterium sp. IPPAS B-1200]|uniref:ribonuclease P protein component n=1 Tax=Cyanobacterium sp. IPPAS B-1200 TaxID=1562720 RepID=UPI0008524890|nr:ribonuclease P protein component [Cyanobacterium sp. IPPAS B-1200]OEJ78781.1 ribonuclease P protein component [Cyanobacterium sp. IPPAS B-1200]
MGLSSRHRLKKRSDFQTVYQHGIRRYSRHLIIRALPIMVSDSLVCPISTKLGISISRKVSKKAVVRNRIKRQIKSAFRSLLPEISSNWLIVITVKSDARECNYEHFLRELKELLIKTDIIYGN